MDENSWHGPMWNDCGVCNFVRRTTDRKFCAWCMRDALQRSATLAANLAQAGGLAESHQRALATQFASAWGIIGRLYAINRALDYDLRKGGDPFLVVRRTNFDAWHLANGLIPPGCGWSATP